MLYNNIIGDVMNKKNDLIKIKEKYGENMMHYCRMMFSTLLDKGILYDLLSSKFAHSKFLYDDIKNNNLEIKFKDYINGLIEYKDTLVKTDKEPYELLQDAGYTLYECHTEEEIENFKKYYREDELLCTFIYQDRLNSCYVFFAVKNNVDDIKRENFKSPQREDLYGTSVISIQFMRGSFNTVSIKNRYNHNVINPDATFSNNLENIIPGLTYSFEKKYNFTIMGGNSNFEIPFYACGNDGKYYRYNYEIHNKYYCYNNVVIDNFDVVKFDKERYILMDYFIVDLQEKTIKLYDEKLKDSFVNYFKDNIKKIDVVRNQQFKILTIKPITGSEVIIILDKYNRIVEYSNENIIEIGNNFMLQNQVLTYINIINTKRLGNNFLSNNKNLLSIDLSKALEIGNCLLEKNIMLHDINITNVLKIGSNCLSENMKIEVIYAPNVIEIGDWFLEQDYKLKEIYTPNLEKCGRDCLLDNKNVKLKVLKK